MYHADKSQSGKQEDQCMAETQVVIDGANQHQEQYGTEQESSTCRNNEYPALGENNGDLFVTAKPEKPLF